jgi:uncharacterized membrane protein
MRRFVHGGVVLWTLVSCSDGVPRAASRPEEHPSSELPGRGASASVSAQALRVPPSRAGRLGLTAGELWFIPCDTPGRRLHLQDLPNGDGVALIKAFRRGDGDVQALVRLSEGRLEEIRYATPEAEGCTRFPTADVVEARGNEPFWSVEIYGDSARLRLPLSPSGVVFTHGMWRRLAGDQWAYEARRGPAGGEEFLLLQLTQTRCVDSMSGAWYPFRAALIRDGDPARGCAVEGRFANAGSGK